MLIERFNLTSELSVILLSLQVAACETSRHHIFGPCPAVTGHLADGD